MKKYNVIHPDLIAAQKLAYEPNNLTLEAIVQETESQEYGACTFTLNNKKILFRVAKITPTKCGQFVTLWKRSKAGPIIPFDESDSFDLVIVSVHNDNQFGQFVFPKNVLAQKGVASKDQKGGKRALRVYPPWDAPDNQQAKKTQVWQLPHFVEIEPLCNAAKIKELLS